MTYPYEISNVSTFPSRESFLTPRWILLKPRRSINNVQCLMNSSRLKSGRSPMDLCRIVPIGGPNDFLPMCFQFNSLCVSILKILFDHSKRRRYLDSRNTAHSAEAHYPVVVQEIQLIWILSWRSHHWDPFTSRWDRMQSPKKVLVIDRFRPQRSGSMELIPIFKKTSNTSFDVVFPVTSTVSTQYPLHSSTIVKEGKKPIFLQRV